MHTQSIKAGTEELKVWRGDLIRFDEKYKKPYCDVCSSVLDDEQVADGLKNEELFVFMCASRTGCRIGCHRHCFKALGVSNARPSVGSKWWCGMHNKEEFEDAPKKKNKKKKDAAPAAAAPVAGDDGGLAGLGLDAPGGSDAEDLTLLQKKIKELEKLPNKKLKEMLAAYKGDKLPAPSRYTNNAQISAALAALQLGLPVPPPPEKKPKPLPLPPPPARADSSRRGCERQLQARCNLSDLHARVNRES